MKRDTFQAVFGVKASRIKANCILMPLLPGGALAALKARKLGRGKVYGVGESADFTLIHTGMGPAFAGDAALYLKETGCRNAFLFGSCGLVSLRDGLSVGSLVSPAQCLAHESFSGMLLLPETEAPAFYPDRELFAGFLNYAGAKVKKTSCATVSSLKLEEQMQQALIKNGVGVVDMECSAFFCASAYAGLRAMALFYVTDIIKEKPFYRALSARQKLELFFSFRNAAGLLREFIGKRLPTF